MKKVDAAEALATTRANPLSRWKGVDNCASDRLRAPICIPFVRPSFTIAKSDTIFAIGSCFARNVEEQLAVYHSEPLSMRISIPEAEISSGRVTGIVNKFNVLSMEQEIAWAAGVSSFPRTAFIKDRTGGFYDPHIRKAISSGTLDELVERRTHIRNYFARSLTADVFIITLGLAEFWFDEEVGLALNEMPDPAAIKLYPKRFSFCINEVSEVIDSLHRIHAILTKHGKPGCKIVITTSPVPFARTFTEHDSIVANMTSKSILRTASLEFANSHPDVDYYPSYEGATLSDRKIVWEDDQLHVSDFMVGRLIRTFLQRYGIMVADAEEEGKEITERSMVEALRKAVDFHKGRTLKLEKELAQLRRAHGVAAE